MMPQQQDPRIDLMCRMYAVMLGAYPRLFRIEFGYEMRQVFLDRCRATAASKDLLRFGGLMLWDWLRSSVRERLDAHRGLEIDAGRELIKGWWLLVVCGLIDGMIAAMHLLRLSPGTRSNVQDLGMLALSAGACAITAAFWNSGRSSFWLLALHGLGLAAFGVIGISPLVRGPLGFRPISLLFVLMAVSAGAFSLRTAHRLGSGARDRWFLIVTGAASLGFACSFPAIGFGWLKLGQPNSYWVWMSSYFGVTALCLLSMAVSLHAASRALRREIGGAK